MTSSEDKKCANHRCDFTAPLAYWPVLKDGSLYLLCKDCRYMNCKVCNYSERVSTWRTEVDGIISYRCLNCTGVESNKCIRCEWEGPLKDWTIVKGKPNKWCWKCCEWARKKSANLSVEVKTEANTRQTDKYKNDEAYRTRRLESAKMRNSVLVACPDCKKEMQPASLKKHLETRACKGKPVDASA